MLLEAAYEVYRLERRAREEAMRDRRFGPSARREHEAPLTRREYVVSALVMLGCVVGAGLLLAFALMGS